MVKAPPCLLPRREVVTNFEKEKVGDSRQFEGDKEPERLVPISPIGPGILNLNQVVQDLQRVVADDFNQSWTRPPCIDHISASF